MNARYAAQIRAGITLARYHVEIGLMCRRHDLHRPWVAAQPKRIAERRELSELGLRAYRTYLNRKTNR